MDRIVIGIPLGKATGGAHDARACHPDPTLFLSHQVPQLARWRLKLPGSTGAALYFSGLSS
jgi:hypothetical protein